MNHDPVLMELEETRRELWKESDGTLAGYARMVDRLGREERERFLAGQARESSKGTWTPETDAVADYADAMCVREGDAPGYGEGKTSDFARKGGDGER